MKTNIKEILNEEIKKEDETFTFGVLFNYSKEDNNWNNSLLYMFNHETKTYIFFTTIIDMIDYYFYRSDKTKRAYLSDDEFEKYYDAEYIEGSFIEKLKWTN